MLPLDPDPDPALNPDPDPDPRGSIESGSNRIRIRIRIHTPGKKYNKYDINHPTSSAPVSWLKTILLIPATFGFVPSQARSEAFVEHPSIFRLSRLFVSFRHWVHLLTRVVFTEWSYITWSLSALLNTSKFQMILMSTIPIMNNSVTIKVPSYVEIATFGDNIHWAISGTRVSSRLITI